MASERLNAAIAEMAKQDITFANCDSTWQKRVMTAVLAAADTRPAPASVEDELYRAGMARKRNPDIAGDMPDPPPAATDTGLETVAKLGGINGVMLLRHIENLRPEAQAAYKDELVRRSQAEELLAAERAEKEAFAEEIKEAAYEAWPEASDVGSDAPHIIRQLGQERDKLEAELAATQAENARLMKINQAHCQTVNTLTIDGARLDGIIRDLKADNAAKDAQIAGWTESGKLWTAEIRELQAENAAQAARIKELEQALETEKTLSRGDWACQREVDQMSIKVEALEAKLASAEKALEAARPYVEDYDTRRHNTGVDETLTQIDAVLGGKPS